MESPVRKKKKKTNEEEQKRKGDRRTNIFFLQGCEIRILPSSAAALILFALDPDTLVCPTFCVVDVTDVIFPPCKYFVGFINQHCFNLTASLSK